MSITPHLFAVLSMTLAGAAGARAPSSEAPFVAGELLVQFQAGATPAQKAHARARIGAQAEQVLVSEAWRWDGKGDLELVRVPPGPVAAAIHGIAADPAVVFAEPNYIYQHRAVSNDPYYTDGSLWGMYGDATTPANPFGSQAGEAWARGNVGSSTVYVGVIDEGIMYYHEDLNGNVWTNPFDPVDGIDNDGNGYVDDTHGWDFDGGDNSIFDGTQDDHGTHVSGTIAARGGNGIGVAGINWNVTLISAKFLGRSGGDTADAVLAVDYLTDLKLRHGLNLVATNNSWGGGGFSQALLDAIDRAGDADILFVAAAGNDTSDNDAVPSYPDGYECTNGGTRGWDCIIAVAALTSTGTLASYSNWGLTTVDLGAPGSAIYSTLPGRKNTSTYGSYSGTSMATPHVTGSVALYKASHPSATASQIRDAILSSVVPTPSLQGITVTGGRLNASGF